MNVLVEMNSVIDWKRRMRAGVTALMNMLVLVGDKTITYNDMLGVSREVPIVSRTKAPEPQTSH